MIIVVEVLGLKKLLAPTTLHTYDDLSRPIMRDIIAVGGNVFDKWIETKSKWIKFRTVEFTNQEQFKNLRRYSPYIL